MVICINRSLTKKLANFEFKFSHDTRFSTNIQYFGSEDGSLVREKSFDTGGSHINFKVSALSVPNQIMSPSFRLPTTP